MAKKDKSEKTPAESIKRDTATMENVAKTEKQKKETEDKNTSVSENSTTIDEEVINAQTIVENKPEPVVEKPFDIYDHEPIKEVLDFPPTELKTETQRAVSQYSLDCRRLPQDVVNKINDYLTEFRSFLSQPENARDISKIPVIIQKDQAASDAIKAWIEPKREYFEQQTLKQAGGIAVTNVNSQPQQQVAQPNTVPQPQMPEGKVVVDKNNIQSIINVVPSVPQSTVNTNQQAHTVVNPLPFHAQAGQNPTPDYNNYNQHQFVPRSPSSTYEHNIGTAGVPNNNLGSINLPPAFGDTSRQVQELMGRMAGNNDGQNHTTMGAPIANQNFLDEYAKTIHTTITTGFPMYFHWGYIPLDSLKDILKNTEKSLSYEIVLNNEESFVKVSNGQKVVETQKFSCR